MNPSMRKSAQKEISTASILFKGLNEGKLFLFILSYFKMSIQDIKFDWIDFLSLL